MPDPEMKDKTTMAETNYTAENTARALLIQGLNINVHVAGDSEQTLVLMHGGGPGASGWGNFRDNVPDLARNFKVVMIDTPHFGASDKPLERYIDAAWYAEIVSEALVQLGIDRAHFVGNSLGGSVAIHLALTHPEQVDRLVLMGTAGSLAMFSALPTEGAKHLMGYYRGEGPTRAKLEAFIRSMIFDQSRITPEFLDARYEASIQPELMVEREIDFEAMFNLWREVHKVPHKTLLVYGRDDRVVPWDTGLLLLRLMPKADLHIFSRSGHWTQWERSAEFNAVVQNFLTGPDT
jgi:4,5:9,10-diseco-3-hydroxy-5,9,17-trioxoandrosta-1(10),2-diene-4-oate hydrolase